MKPLISIIVPIYKVPENFLRQCVESCIKQSLSEVEIILVDDGSPDDCGVICDEYAAKDNRIKVIHKVNGGLAAARNTGFDAATGIYMMFLDGDDYLDEETCEEIYFEMVKSDADILMFDQIIEYDNSSRILYSIKDNPQGLNYKQSMYDEGRMLFEGETCKDLQLRVLNFNGRIAMAFQKLIKMEYLNKYNIRHVDELRQGMEGFVFNIQLFNYTKKVVYLSKPLYHYTYNVDSITHKPSEQNYYLCVKCCEWMLEYANKCERCADLKQSIYNRMLYLIVNTAISCYFSPLMPISYKKKVESMRDYMMQPIIKVAMIQGDRTKLDYQRKFILLALEYDMYPVIWILGKIRKKQLDNR